MEESAKVRRRNGEGARGREVREAERGTEKTATYLTFRVATDITGGNF